MVNINSSAALSREINLNSIKAAGTIVGNAEYSHNIVRKVDGGKLTINFIRFTLEVPRLSGLSDFLDVVVPENVWLDFEKSRDSGSGEDAVVEVSGRIQSYNHAENSGRNKLDVFIYAKSIRAANMDEKPNSAIFEGYLCRNPIIRETPLGRNIADLFIAVNRLHGATYIPVILWGGNATAVLNLRAGDKLRFTGRFQSRQYWKSVDGEMVRHTVHEVSAATFKLLEE